MVDVVGEVGMVGAFLRWSEASLPPPQFCLTQPWSRCSSEILRRHGEYLQFTLDLQSINLNLQFKDSLAKLLFI